jgi:hypothetical protein
MPDPRRAKPARCEAADGLQIEGFGRRLNSTNTSDPGRDQESVHSAVRQMLDLGAEFEILRRVDRPVTWLWKVTDAGDRAACRRIVETARAHGGSYWRAFEAAIIACAGGSQ